LGKELSVIARGAGFYFAGFAVSKVLAYFYRVIVARGLGPEAYGIFAIGLGIIGIVTIFAALGLYQGMLHFVAIYNSLGKQEKSRGTILLALKAQLISSIAFAAGLFLASDYIAVSLYREPGLAIVLKIFALSLPFAIIASGLMVVVLAFKKIEYKIYVRNLIENIAKVSFTAIFLFLGFQLFGAALGVALSSVVALVVSLYIVQKKVFPLFGKNLKAKYNGKELFYYSWPLLAVGFFDIIMSSIDVIMLGYLSKAYDVGIYGVASPTANLLIIASFAFGSLFLPIITGLYARKKLAALEKTFKTVSRWTFAAMFPCLLFTILFAGEILEVMFGPVYAQGAGALIVLAIGIFMVSFVGPVSDILESIKMTKLIFLNTVLSGAVNVGLNLWLIPLFEASGAAIIGAALATSASFFLWNLLAMAEVFILTKMHPYNKAYLAPTLAATVAIALFFFAKQAVPSINVLSFPFDLALLLLFACLFLCLYGLLFILFKGIQPDDLEILKLAEKKAGFRIKFLRDFVKKFI